MTRSKFIIELEEYWVKKYGSDWAQGEIAWNDLINAWTELND